MVSHQIPRRFPVDSLTDDGDVFRRLHGLDVHPHPLVYGIELIPCLKYHPTPSCVVTEVPITYIAKEPTRTLGVVARCELKGVVRTHNAHLMGLVNPQIVLPVGRSEILTLRFELSSFLRRDGLLRVLPPIHNSEDGLAVLLLS